MKYILILIILFVYTIPDTRAQESGNRELKFFLDEEKTHYVKFTGLGQVWIRNTQLNPGSTINGELMDAYTDISLRRLRFQVIAQLTDRLFFYTQFGQNNFNFNSEKYTGAFFHDAIVEYALVPGKLSLGTGLTGWSGLTRYAAPSIGSLLTLDAPLYQQATNGVNDQFIRKLSVYAKGQLGKFDYRIALTQPMSVTGLDPAQTDPVSTVFSFANGAPDKQLQAYFSYQFFDRESNQTPYQKGSYLGGKKIFNIGAGIIYQPDAMWAQNQVSETVYEDMVLLGVDVFYDNPIGQGQAITLYGAYTNYDFGAGYYRNVGVNGPATGSNGNPGGSGNAYPMIGTGPTVYGQIGYLFGKHVITESGKLLPFLSAQYSDYDFSEDPMLMYEVGLNYLIDGAHGNKLSLMYQSRPTLRVDSGEIILDSRKGMTVVQYHVAF